jgi:hypothetical protein
MLKYPVITLFALTAGFANITQGQQPKPKTQNPQTQTQRQTDEFIIKPGREDFKPIRNVSRTRVTGLTGSLSVASESGARIYLEQVGNTKFKLQGQIKASELQFIVNDLKPGLYRVSAELDGYKTARGTGSTQEVSIVANKVAQVDFKLLLITYNFTVETNVKTGEVRYSPVGRSNQMIAQLRNGRAVLRDLAPGKYNLEILPEELGYPPHKETVEVGDGNTSFKANLKRRVSEDTFTANWATLDDWNVPSSGWGVANEKLTAKKKGVGLPGSEALRHYTDFRLVCNVRMLNDVAASFALRAQEKPGGKLSYYLIQITGARADQPHVLRGFVVIDGVEKKLPSISYAAEQLPAGQFFRVIIDCVGNSISVKVTGDEIPLGELKDFDRQILIGAPGIAVRDNEEVEVEMFYITPKK